VMGALKHVNRSKAYVQKLYPQIKRPWDAWGCPSEILLDRDWAHQSPSFQHSMSNIGIDVHYAPADTPQYKSMGERPLHTINQGLIHKLPGAVPYNVYVMRQVGLDPTKDKLITYDDLLELLHEFNDIYSYRPHDGLGAVPARIWEEGLAVQRRRFISDVGALDHVLGRVHVATISGAGIKFQNMRWHDEGVTSLLLNDLVRYEKKRSQDTRTFGQARARVVVKWNPADASSISVWNRGGEPPHWVKMPNADPEFIRGLSFWHHERILEFAKEKDLAFSTEEERWDAFNLLRGHWESLAAEMPMRKSRLARRGIAFDLGRQIEEMQASEPICITLDDIRDAEVEASTAGLNRVEPEGVPDQIAAELLDRENLPNKGRTPSKAAIAKTGRTKKRKKLESERAEHDAYVKQRRGDPTGDPHARGIPVQDNYDDDDGWGATTPSPVAASNEFSEYGTADEEGW